LGRIELKVIIVGLGYVGLPIAIQAAQAGHDVLGFDLSEKRISQLLDTSSLDADVDRNELLEVLSKNKLSLTSNLGKIPPNSIIVIAVPTPLTENRMPDLRALKLASEMIAASVSDSSLIINESTSYIGTLRDLIKPTIENNTKAQNLKYAVAPERIDPGNENWNINTTPRVISGLTEEAASEAVKFYSSFCLRVHRVSSAEIAEASKLFENTFRLVNIALVNELSKVADKMGLKASEIIEAAATKPFGFMPFWPSIGVGGHCIPVDPTYLNYSVQKFGTEFNFINLANSINSMVPENVIVRIEESLGFGLKNKRVQIAGISYKPNVSDLRESPALTLIEMLKLRGAIVTWHDPVVNEHNFEMSTPISKEIDLGLIITPHENIDFSIWINAGTKVIDLSSNPEIHGWPKYL